VSGIEKGRAEEIVGERETRWGCLDGVRAPFFEARRTKGRGERVRRQRERANSERGAPLRRRRGEAGLEETEIARETGLGISEGVSERGAKTRRDAGRTGVGMARGSERGGNTAKKIDDQKGGGERNRAG